MFWRKINIYVYLLFLLFFNINAVLKLIKSTHWGRNKWPPLSRWHFRMHYLEKQFWFQIWFTFHWNFFLCSIDNKMALVQVMAWHRPGEEPLSEPMMVRLLTEIWAMRPEWVNPQARQKKCLHRIEKLIVEVHYVACKELITLHIYIIFGFSENILQCLWSISINQCAYKEQIIYNDNLLWSLLLFMQFSKCGGYAYVLMAKPCCLHY